MVRRTRLNITLYIHSLSVFFIPDLTTWTDVESWNKRTRHMWRFPFIPNQSPVLFTRKVHHIQFHVSRRISGPKALRRGLESCTRAILTAALHSARLLHLLGHWPLPQGLSLNFIYAFLTLRSRMTVTENCVISFKALYQSRFYCETGWRSLHLTMLQLRKCKMAFAY